MIESKKRIPWLDFAQRCDKARGTPGWSASCPDRETPPLLWAVLDEQALHRHVGGPAVMREQLAHLLDLSQRFSTLSGRRRCPAPPPGT